MMTATSSIRIEELTKTEIKQAAELVSKTMASNPIHIAVFKSSTEEIIKKQQKMFEYVFSQYGKKIYVARLNGELVGMMCYTSSQHCQLKPLELIRVLPRMFKTLDKHLLPVLIWQKKWGKHDHSKPHVHLGPLAVAPTHQGKGVGKMLMIVFCDYLNTTCQLGYLETDKQENVFFYQKFGFRIIEEEIIFGVKNWFMMRPHSKYLS